MKAAVEHVELDSAAVRAAVASALGLSRGAVSHALRGRSVAATVGEADRVAVARDAVQALLDADEDVARRDSSAVLAELSRAQHRRRVQRVLDRLAEAGIAAQRSPDERAILVDGRSVAIPDWRAPWKHEQVMAAITQAALAEHLLRSVSRHLSGLALRALTRPEGVVLISPTRVVARVSATRAVVLPPRSSRASRDAIDGNFLAGGPHWQRLAASLRRVLPTPPRAAAAASRPPRRDPVLTRMSDALPADVRELAAFASQLIREERTTAFEHAVRLQLPDESVRFEPIRGEGAALEVPYVYRAPGGAVRAALRLRTPADPLALAVEHADGDALLGRSWVTALVAYADLTCVPQAERARTGLVASGATDRLLAANVAGHRRRLRQRRAPSPAAVRAADRAGITLRAHETWVRPHLRGVPADTVLTFDWTPPAALGEPETADAPRSGGDGPLLRRSP